MKATVVNKYGDLQCPTPNCIAVIITPLCCDVRAGMGKCEVCEQRFFVSEEVAKLANERAKAWAGRKDGE